jgi:hypothetical protein
MDNPASKKMTTSPIINFLGIYQQQLRYFNTESELIPTPAEVAKQERQEKVLALQQIEQLKSRLRELGVDPEEI